MASSNAESTLRKVLLANSEFSVLTGLASLIFGGRIADFLEVEQAWLIRLIGAGLLGFAVAVFVIARSKRPVLDEWSLQVSYGDLGWVIATVPVIALGWLSTEGAVVMAAIAVVVLALGIGQLRSRRAMLATAV